jgi:hypothetical protein
MGFFSKLLGWFAGDGKTAEKVTELADEAFHTEQEKAVETQAAVDTDQKDLLSARAMQMVSHNTWFDAAVDGLNRLVRPGITVWILGGFMGFWLLPRTDQISEYWQSVFWLVLTFWFGGRALLKDLPSAIRTMRGL